MQTDCLTRPRPKTHDRPAVAGSPSHRRPDRDRRAHTGRLDHPPNRSVPCDDDLAGDPGGGQGSAQPEQDPEAGAVDVVEPGQVDRDRPDAVTEAFRDLLLDGVRVRQVDLPGDRDQYGVAPALDRDGGLVAAGRGVDQGADDPSPPAGRRGPSSMGTANTAGGTRYSPGRRTGGRVAARGAITSGVPPRLGVGGRPRVRVPDPARAGRRGGAGARWCRGGRAG